MVHTGVSLSVVQCTNNAWAHDKTVNNLTLHDLEEKHLFNYIHAHEHTEWQLSGKGHLFKASTAGY